MPLLSPPPPPARRGGSSRRLSRIRRRRSRRQWADLPLDALLHVLHKLDHVDLMFGGASRTCRSWRSAAREPELWRRIDLRGHCQLFREIISVKRMARLAIWFSAGQCMEFTGDNHYVDDDLIRFLANQAPLLKSLRLTQFSVSKKIFAKAIQNWPLLEELELSTFYKDLTKTIGIVATTCPQLKHFKSAKAVRYHIGNSEALAIARMHQLRSLQLFRSNLDIEGLTVILDNCPHLEILDLRGCYNIAIDSSLQAKCSRIKTKYFEPISHMSYYSRDHRMYLSGDDERDCEFLYAEGHDSQDLDQYYNYNRAEEIDFEEHERSFDKGTRRHRRRYFRV